MSAPITGRGGVAGGAGSRPAGDIRATDSALRSLDRRRFLVSAGAGALALFARGAGAQDANSQTMGPMDATGHRPVRRPPKPGAAPQVSIEQRDALERQIACQCPCTLDVFTCRTTDFSCQVSPAMHRDVMSLVEGGYDAREIIAAFEADYGEKVLMAPTKRGFNLVGWIAPFAALGGGALLVAALIQRWGRRAALVRASTEASAAPNASDAELARLAAAVRDDR